MRPIALLLAGLTVASARLVAQSCSEPHYRWSEKTTLELAAQVATRTSIHSMLTSWPQPAIYGAADKCTARTGRELKVYSVTAWVRRWRIESPPDGDGDWHLELTTADSDTVPNNCIVVEIPSPEYGAQYDVARNALTTLIVSFSASMIQVDRGFLTIDCEALDRHRYGRRRR